MCRRAASLIRFAFPITFLHAVFFLVIFGRLVAAAVRTVVIDDTYGDAATGAMPIYSPDGVWTQGQPCLLGDCHLVNPDPNLVGNGTWHDSVGKADDAPPRTIDLAFEGNSINVFCIISEVDQVEIAVSNMTFELDGVEGKPFFYDVSGEMDAAGNYKITYNVSVYHDAFAQGKHTLRINSIGYSRMLFDYVLYTTDSNLASSTTAAPLATTSTNSPQHPHSPPRPNFAIIVGVAIGGIVLLAIAVVVFLLIRRRRRLRNAHVHQIDSLSRRDMLMYKKDNIDARSYMSSSDSVALENPRPATPFFPYADLNHLDSQTSLSPLAPHEDLEEHRANPGPSPSDSIPLMRFPGAGQSDSGSRIIVSVEETRLEGPDNSMARFARQKVAEREAELTRRMREVEAALAAKYATGPSSSKAAATAPPQSQSRPIRSDTLRSAASQASSSSEAALGGQVEELRAEIDRMRMVQQQMALELRDATEPPPEYQ